MPISSCGLRIGNEEIRVAVGFRLGIALCETHLCPCCVLVHANGLRGSSCKSSSVKHARHASINDLVFRVLKRAEIPAIMKPTGFSRIDGKRSGCSSLIPWKTGKSVLWV